MYTVKHPNPYFSGVRCGITFTNGQCIVAEITEAQRFHFERWGITIEGQDVPDAPKGKKSKGENVEPPE